MFENPSLGGSGQPGTAVRALAAGAAGVHAYHPSAGAGVRGVAGGNGFGVQGDCNHTAGVGGQFLNRAATPGAGAQGFFGQTSPSAIRDAVSTAVANVFSAGAGFTDGYGLQSTGTFIGVHAATNKPDGIALLATGAGGNGQNGAGIICNGDAHVTGSSPSPADRFASIIRSTRRTSSCRIPSSNLRRCSTSTAERRRWTTQGKPPSHCPTGTRRSIATIAISSPGLDAFAPVYVAERIANGRCSIAGGTKGLQVCWQVTGVRKDAWAEANRIPVESVKSAPDRGRYLNPELIGPRAELLRSFGSRQPAEARLD